MPQNPNKSEKTGVAIMVTPVSRPFELVIAASKQLPCGVWPDGATAFWSCWADSPAFLFPHDAKRVLQGGKIGKRNHGIRQCLHWLMQATCVACGHDSNLPSAQKSRYPNGYLLFWSCWADSNCRPHPYQGCALPTELQQQSTCPLLGACVATEKGLEPSTSGVTGRRSNRLNHSATAQLV